MYEKLYYVRNTLVCTQSSVCTQCTRTALRAHVARKGHRTPSHLLFSQNTTAKWQDGWKHLCITRDIFQIDASRQKKDTLCQFVSILCQFCVNSYDYFGIKSENAWLELFLTYHFVRFKMYKIFVLILNHHSNKFWYNPSSYLIVDMFCLSGTSMFPEVFSTFWKFPRIPSN